MIEAAGWTLLHFLWQGALIGALFALTLTIARRPQVRYLAGCGALLAMIGAVAATFGHHYQPNELEPPTAAAETIPEQPTPITISFTGCRPCHLGTSTESFPTAHASPGSAVGACLNVHVPPPESPSYTCPTPTEAEPTAEEETSPFEKKTRYLGGPEDDELRERVQERQQVAKNDLVRLKQERKTAARRLERV